MSTPTYTAIASITLGSSASSVTFSSIPQDYRDLVLVVNGTKTTTGTTLIDYEFNADSGTNYSRVFMFGTGSDTVSNSADNESSLRAGYISNIESLTILQIVDYSATDKHKTALSRANISGDEVRALAGRYASTSAITSIVASPSSDSFSSGTTLALYGIVS